MASVVLHRKAFRPDTSATFIKSSYWQCIPNLYSSLWFRWFNSSTGFWYRFQSHAWTTMATWQIWWSWQLASQIFTQISLWTEIVSQRRRHWIPKHILSRIRRQENIWQEMEERQDQRTSIQSPCSKAHIWWHRCVSEPWIITIKCWCGTEGNSRGSDTNPPGDVWCVKACVWDLCRF